MRLRISAPFTCLTIAPSIAAFGPLAIEVFARRDHTHARRRVYAAAFRLAVFAADGAYIRLLDHDATASPTLDSWSASLGPTTPSGRSEHHHPRHLMVDTFHTDAKADSAAARSTKRSPPICGTWTRRPFRRGDADVFSPEKLPEDQP